MIRLRTTKAKPLVDYLYNDKSLKAHDYALDHYTGEYVTKYNISPKMAMRKDEAVRTLMMNFVAGNVKLPQRARLFN